MRFELNLIDSPYVKICIDLDLLSYQLDSTITKSMM
jgi:hypothetical protein